MELIIDDEKKLKLFRTKMIQTELDQISSNEKTNILSHSSETQSRSCSSIAMHTVDRPSIHHDSTLNSSINNTEDENIDWELVTKQLETKLRASIDIISSPSDDSDRIKILKNYRFHPITNHQSAVNTDDKTKLSLAKQHLKANDRKQNLNQMETNMSTCATKTGKIQELFEKLTICQQQQVCLLQQIQQLIKESKQISSSSFFLPLNSSSHFNSKDIPSLQHVFQQRKSTFIQQSKQRINEIYRHHHKQQVHHRIIPKIKLTKNTYLQERRQKESDRLCAMIIKHRNRQNAKIYGNLIKNQLCHN